MLPIVTLAVARQAAGRPVDMRNTLMAGIALARRATLATRNAALREPGRAGR